MSDTGIDPDSLSISMDNESILVDRQADFAGDMAERIRIRAKQKSVAQSALADFAGIKRTTMTSYWSGARPYPLEVLLKLAEKLSTNVDWLLTGGDADSGHLDLVGVQEIDLAYGLGGTFSDVPIEVRIHRFPRDWLEAITRTSPSMLTFARGRGDSMQPTLQDGDIVLIDRSIRTVYEQDAIWALTVGDIAMIKRVRVRGEHAHLLSDNDRVPPDEVPIEEVNVVGRVIFIGRKL